MLDAIKDLDENMIFAQDETQVSGVVQIHVTLPVEELEQLPKEQVTEEMLRASVRAQMVKFLYGELIEDITALRTDLNTGDEWVDALEKGVDPLDAILKKLGVELDD